METKKCTFFTACYYLRLQKVSFPLAESYLPLAENLSTSRKISLCQRKAIASLCQWKSFSTSSLRQRKLTLPLRKISLHQRKISLHMEKSISASGITFLRQRKVSLRQLKTSVFPVPQATQLAICLLGIRRSVKLCYTSGESRGGFKGLFIEIHSAGQCIKYQYELTTTLSFELDSISVPVKSYGLSKKLGSVIEVLRYQPPSLFTYFSFSL